MKVSVYSTTTCPYCVMLKKWLKDKDIEFDDIYVDRDRAAAQKMVKLSGQMGVPFTTIEGEDGKLQGVLGFDVPTISHLLNVSA